MRLGSHEVANFGAPYVIAEIGANHNGDMTLCRKIIDAAKEAGAHCVKFQSWSKISLFSKSMYKDSPEVEKQIDAFATTEKQLREMRDYCQQTKIDFASSVFSEREADFLLDELGAPFVKMASMDLNNFAFLEYVAKKMKPMILSTGLSTLAEIDEAVQTVYRTGNRKLVILHCISNYPPKDENVNLRNIDMLQGNFPEAVIGFSDHTLGALVPLAAIARGAAVIEKHFTVDKKLPGWDHAISAEPSELREIVAGGQRIAAVLGSTARVLSKDDFEKIPAFRRSIVAARPIPAGHVIQASDLVCKRPGSGIEPKHMRFVVGRTAKRALEADQMITMEDF